MRDYRRELEEKLRSDPNLKGVGLPSGIDFSECEDGTIRMKLSGKAIGLPKDGKKAVNMQDNTAAFEGWAIILHVHLKKKILLDIQKDAEPSLTEAAGTFTLGKGGHFHRFLYRAQKFKEQYGDWFSLEKPLEDAAGKFIEWLYAAPKLVQNAPVVKDAGKNAYGENIEESNFADSGVGFLFKGEPAPFDKVYRQLPVGLFQNEVKKANSIFTNGKSAIDLWAISGDKLAVFELKTDNEMIGIITELFFYANYMFDLCISHRFSLNSESKDRGYDKLRNAQINQICAYMLTDKLHPLITEDVIKALNPTGNKKIQYEKLCYIPTNRR